MFSTLDINNNNPMIGVVSIFDYHKKKSPPILRLHCVCGGRAYGSLIFQKHCEIDFKIFLLFVLKITVLRSHTSHHDWLGVYCFPSKLWVPTNFHTGSLELCYQDILDILELWKQDGWRDVVFVSDSIYSAVYSVWGQVI